MHRCICTNRSPRRCFQYTLPSYIVIFTTSHQVWAIMWSSEPDICPIRPTWKLCGMNKWTNDWMGEFMFAPLIKTYHEGVVCLLYAHCKPTRATSNKYTKVERYNKFLFLSFQETLYMSFGWPMTLTIVLKLYCPGHVPYGIYIYIYIYIYIRNKFELSPTLYSCVTCHEPWKNASIHRIFPHYLSYIICILS